MVRLQFQSSEEFGVPRSTLIWSGSTCYGSINGSNRTVQSFNKDYSYWLIKSTTVGELFVLDKNTWYNIIMYKKKQIYKNCNYELTMKVIP